MKKLERLLEKLIGDMRASDIISLVISVLAILAVTVFDILWATEGFYSLLAAVTFLYVWIVSVLINKVFLEKTNDYLKKTPKATTLIFTIVCIITLILSVSYFIGVIISAILAFMLADYQKNKQKE